MKNVCLFLLFVILISFSACEPKSGDSFNNNQFPEKTENANNDSLKDISKPPNYFVLLNSFISGEKENVNMNKFDPIYNCETDFTYNDGVLILQLEVNSEKIYFYISYSVEEEIFGNNEIKEKSYYEAMWKKMIEDLGNKYYYTLDISAVQNPDSSKTVNYPYKNLSECIDLEKYNVLIAYPNESVLFQKADEKMLMNGIQRELLFIIPKKEYHSFEEFIDDPFIFDNRITFKLEGTEFLNELLINSNKFFELLK